MRERVRSLTSPICTGAVLSCIALTLATPASAATLAADESGGVSALTGVVGVLAIALGVVGMAVGLVRSRRKQQPAAPPSAPTPSAVTTSPTIPIPVDLRATLPIPHIPQQRPGHPIDSLGAPRNH